MFCARQIYVLFLMILWCPNLRAQRILYAKPFRGAAVQYFTIAGKTGNNYWVHKQQKRKRVDEVSFDIYNNRLELLHTVPAATVTTATLKKYFICGDHFFDELVLTAAHVQTNIILRRYDSDGQLLADTMLASLPFTESGNGFILVSSADKSKILLLGFEPVAEKAPRLHALLFNSNWKILSSLVYEKPFLVQPFIQDDFYCYPSQANYAPVQLANNGEWLICSPSRISNNFLLLHFDARSPVVGYKEIQLPPMYKMEDLALYINNETKQAFAGILSNYRQKSQKNVHVTHYSFITAAFDFDSSYWCSTLPLNQSKENNLTKESFIAIPNMGFMLLKEYGRFFNSWYQHQETTPVSFASNTSGSVPVNANGYTRFSNSNTPAGVFSRGDLSLFYFPANAVDSCWAGFVNKKQVTELNAPNLSYLFVPMPDKLVLLYNSADREEDPFGATLSLDGKGNPMSERELISWQSDQSLIFQQATQIAPNEIAVPYQRSGQKSLAIIRF